MAIQTGGDSADGDTLLAERTECDKLVAPIDTENATDLRGLALIVLSCPQGLGRPIRAARNVLEMSASVQK